MLDVPVASPDEVAVLLAANARLRLVVEGKDELIAELEARSRAELAVRDRRIAALAARLAELGWRLSMDSSTSSTPPSADSIGAKAKRKAARRTSQRERSKDRKPGEPPRLPVHRSQAPFSVLRDLHDGHPWIPAAAGIC